MPIRIKSKDVIRHHREHRLITPAQFDLIEQAFKNYVEKRTKDSKILEVEWTRFSLELKRLL